MDADGKLEEIVDEGITLGYQHQWSDEFTSLVVYNQGLNNNTDGQTDGSIHKSNYFTADLIWHFLPKAFVGAEYLHGTRTDKSEVDGSADRLQFSVKYIFN